MSLKQWAANGWLQEESISQHEIKNLLAIVERDLQDAAGDLSSDWRFGIAYNAALKLCTALLRAEGYRAAHGLQHYRNIMAMPLILGEDRKSDAQYIDACRIKHNTLEYDYVGGASEQDAEELIAFAKVFRQTVLDWLKEHHPELAP